MNDRMSVYMPGCPSSSSRDRRILVLLSRYTPRRSKCGLPFAVCPHLLRQHC